MGSRMCPCQFYLHVTLWCDAVNMAVDVPTHICKICIMNGQYGWTIIKQMLLHNVFSFLDNCGSEVHNVCDKIKSEWKGYTCSLENLRRWPHSWKHFQITDLVYLNLLPYYYLYWCCFYEILQFTKSMYSNIYHIYVYTILPVCQYAIWYLADITSRLYLPKAGSIGTILEYSFPSDTRWEDVTY